MLLGNGGICQFENFDCSEFPTGQLWDGSQIAVKRLKAWSGKEKIDFAVEMEILACH
ncbi:unnamed protein product [Arabis nemorensis]|uniref:Uncharacterized protein n=1 Tax=Arabis nemorensis TaxID=586526 RepID=A0A565CBL1_9BRAS|nr:unnamed protein product [Arabis nemorensis]